MEKISDSLGKFFSILVERWETLNNYIKFGLIGLFVLIMGSILAFALQKKEDPMQYVFLNISAEDVTAITAFLKKHNYENYIVDEKGVKVPDKEVDALRVQLSQEGLPYKGMVGWEKFDQESFTRTEFEQEVHRLRAVQGELGRTISSIKGITSARVHLVVPKTSMFLREQKEPSASIYLSTISGIALEKKQIKGIQYLVSKAVEGLKLNNIVIIDASGQILTEIESSDEAAAQSKELLDYKKNIERSLEDRIRSIVGKVVGVDRIEAKVDAQIDFTKERQTISDVNPDQVVVVSKNSSGFSMEGQGLNPTGIPGSKSNVPGEQESVGGGGSKSGSKRETELINYEFSKVVSEKTLPVGGVQRLTISAIVDGKQLYPLDGSIPEFAARTPEEMKKIEELIKNAVGFKENRDSLTVHNMMFQLDPVQQTVITEKKKEEREYFSTLAIAATLSLALILFFAFIIRPYFRWLTYDPERKEDQSYIEEYKPNLEIASMQSVQVQEEVPFERMTPKEQVLYLAKNEPKRTTEALRLLISPSAPSGG